jgi:FkbM family methyltransferase
MLKQAVGLVGRLMSSAKWRYQIAKYAKFGPNHVFDVKVDDLSLKMTFLDHKIGNAIVERLQGRREPNTVAVIRSLVRPGSKILELGGCYGYFTYIMATCAGDEGKVVSIEGTPNNFKILRRNIELNNLKTVDAYNLFITDKADHVSFGPSEEHPYLAIDRLLEHRDNGDPANVSVPTVCLSSFLEKIRFDPDYVFMDIEGFEIDVFKDFSARYFLRHRPVIVFEIHQSFYRGQENLDFIKDILLKNHYYYRRDGSNLLCFPRSIDNSGVGRAVAGQNRFAGLSPRPLA